MRELTGIPTAAVGVRETRGGADILGGTPSARNETAAAAWTASGAIPAFTAASAARPIVVARSEEAWADLPRKVQRGIFVFGDRPFPFRRVRANLTGRALE